MSLSKEHISSLKKQLLDQIKNLPEEKKKEAEKQIESLSDEAIEEMLEYQKESEIRLFREIVSGKVPSKKIDENESAIAVLDIKPLSKGHTLIVPKERLPNIDKIPKEISIFIDKISKKLSEKLKPNNIKIIPEIKFGEVIINIIPIYDKDISLDYNRINESESDLNKTVELLNKNEEKIEVKELKKEEVKELKRFQRRIP